MVTTAAGLSKPADVEFPVHPLIAERWSPRAFGPRPVAAATLHSILEAARWAPSAGNQQPWHFLVAVADQPEAFERLLGVLSNGNSRWARHAPVLMLAVARLYEKHRGHPGFHSLYDLGLAVGLLTVQAAAHGLVVHQMGGFSIEKAHTDLQIPEGYVPVAAIALGYPGDHETLRDDLKERELAPRVRRPQSAFVFGARWGDSSPLEDRSW